MTRIEIDRLCFGRHPVDEDGIEIFDVRDEDSSHGEVYSCVALYRRNWRDDWPALGGTRWLMQTTGGPIPTPEMARAEAASLALAMFMKNNLLRKAELELALKERQQLFGWQGGKGVIWTPWDAGDKRINRKYLTPRRLMCHGLLIEQLRGEYIGSKDAGVGGSELRWIERATNFTIGNGCKADTGEGTAYGVHAGMRTTLEILGKASDEKQKMKGVPVLICGLGKVGFPLMQILHDDGAVVSIWEPLLPSTSDADLHAYYEKTKSDGAAIAAKHLQTLKAIRKNVFSSEAEALQAAPKSATGVHIVCPAGSRIEWLTEQVNGKTRYATLAARENAGGCIVLGPANDQLPMSSDHRGARDHALETMTAAGVLYVPDPVVSPGGVIAVSHELTAHWNRKSVNRDSIHIVEKSIHMLFDRADDKRNSTSVYQAFEQLALD